MKPEYKEILLAIADGKDVECKRLDNNWYPITYQEAINYMYKDYVAFEFRVAKPKVTINGELCEAPPDRGYCITIKHRYGGTTVLRFPEQKECDAIYEAIIKFFISKETK